MKKRTRRYREILSGRTFSVSSGHKPDRIHDFLKGWGTVAKDGKSILWDWWRPPTKRQREQSRKRHEKWVAKGCPMVLPRIKNFPQMPDLRELMSVQPMSELPKSVAFPMDFVYSASGSKNSS